MTSAGTEDRAIEAMKQCKFEIASIHLNQEHAEMLKAAFANEA